MQVCKRGDASVCVSACVCLFVGRWGGAFVVCVCVCMSERERVCL